MRLYLIRHAVTGETGKLLSGRQTGIHLSAEGRGMATALATRLEPVKLAAIYSSPIERCVETAAMIAAGRGLEIQIDESFIEVEFGNWTGRSLRSLYRLKAWGRLLATPSRFRFPGGESPEEVQRRVVAGVERLAADHRRDPVALVTHADVVRLAIAHYLGTPLDLIGRIDALPASVSIVSLAPDGGVRVPVVNDVSDPGRWR
jgi:broad specificity phosphatase PhoE